MVIKDGIPLFLFLSVLFLASVSLSLAHETHEEPRYELEPCLSQCGRDIVDMYHYLSCKRLCELRQKDDRDPERPRREFQ
jgi:hypothetical protein